MPFASDILFPVDFSASSAAMLPAVAALARRFAAPVTLLHVAGDAAVAAGSEDQFAYVAAADAFAGLTVRPVLATGEPAKAIVEQASALAAPLITMPSRGTTSFRQLLLGSVTASVLHDAHCPVWTSAHCLDGGPIPTAYASVVCAVDCGPRTTEVLRAAAAFAHEFGASLHVVHSVPGIDPRFESGAANRAHSFLVDSARRDYPALANAAGVAEPLEILEDRKLAEGINEASVRHGADLLVIGRGVVQGVLGRLRTNAHDLIRLSRCPVLSV